jgi:hypothetical protein
VPAYRRYYEKIRSLKRNVDSFTGGFDLYRPNFLKKWKPVQHYKRYIDYTDEDRRGIVWGSVSLTSLGSYVQAPLNFCPALLGADSEVFRSKFGIFGDHIQGLTSMTSAEKDGGFIPAPSGLNILVENGLNRILPSVKEEMNLINFIIELKDFKTLPSTLRSMYRLIAKIDSIKFGWSRKVLKQTEKLLNRNVLAFQDQSGRVFRDVTVQKSKYYWKVRRSFAYSDGPTLREIFQTTADAYLQKEFGVEPFLRDVVALFEALIDVDKRMKRLLNMSGRTMTKHYSFSWQEVAVPSEDLSETNTYLLNLGQFAGSDGPAGTTGAYREHALGWKAFRRVTYYNPTKFHLEAEYYYNFTQFQLENARVLYLEDRIGLSQINLATLWNAIPWSFIVDWVLGVNRWLSGRRVLQMEPTIGISRVLWSVKRYRRIATWLKTTSKGYNIPVTVDTYLPTMYETTYRRDTELPVRNNPAIFGSSLNSRELSLGVALTITSRKRLTNRAG